MNNSNRKNRNLNKSKGIGKPVRNQQGRVCGYIRQGVLEKCACASKHMLRTPKGWAWDDEIITQAEGAGCARTRITDKESGKIYTASLNDFRQHGVMFERRFGRQVCLALAYWQVFKPGEPIAEQLSF
jgi:hypothetical protein